MLGAVTGLRANGGTAPLEIRDTRANAGLLRTEAPDGAEASADATGSRPMVVNRIKKALVTSRLTLGSQDTGLDPYDSRCAANPGAVWSGRVR
jgi:hypothetical protein